MAVSVTSKGQVTIPKKVRDALGITPGSKVDFELEGGRARLRLVGSDHPSDVREGPAILAYKGRRIAIDELHGGRAMANAVKRARR